MGLGKAELSFTVIDASKLPEPRVPRWAVLGRSNVGKSSLLNAMIHPQKLFRSGGRAGQTIGLIGVKVHMGQSEKSIIEIVDLPGYGFSHAHAGDPFAEDLIEALRAQQGSCALHWLWLCEGGRSPDNLDVHCLNWLRGEPFTFIFTKSDRIGKNKRQACEKEWISFTKSASESLHWTSSKTGEGMALLQKEARQFLRKYYEA
jgi:GTP-binding protein